MLVVQTAVFQAKPYADSTDATDQPLLDLAYHPKCVSGFQNFEKFIS